MKRLKRQEVTDAFGRTHVTELGAPLGVGRDFYVTVLDHDRTGFLLGPFISHADALANVERGRKLAESVNDRAIWYAYGTASAPHGTVIKTVFGMEERP